MVEEVVVVTFGMLSLQGPCFSNSALRSFTLTLFDRLPTNRCMSLLLFTVSAQINNNYLTYDI